jgi:predicted RNA-binding Zn-ribbon protein involved in translation (DUF1610 family)
MCGGLDRADVPGCVDERRPEVKCPDCGAEMILRETKKFIYPNSKKPRKFYGCSRYPECKATHGAHPDGKPLGTPGDSETKLHRRQVHIKMDEILSLTGWSKGEYYSWVAERLGWPEPSVHAGGMNIDQCKAVVAVISEEIERMNNL